VRLSLIAAVARNGVIGKDGALPWRLSADLKRFKAVTTGHAVIMGRRTWEEIRRPLPGRRNIVLSRDLAFDAPGAEVVTTLADAIERARTSGDGEAFVIGGAHVYAAALPIVDRLHLTRLDYDAEGDTRFPPLDLSGFRLVSEERHEAAPGDPAPYAFLVYDRPRA